jgi:hypothetical protein
MAKQLYWSIQTAGSTQSSPPAGLGCLNTPESLLLAFVSDSADPDGVLLDTSHVDVLNWSLVRGRRVAALVCKLIVAEFNSSNSTWELLIEYDDTALEDEDRELSHCDICQIECLTCDAQAKLAGAGSSGESDPEWNAAYEGYLTEFPELDGGGLDDLTPP